MNKQRGVITELVLYGLGLAAVVIGIAFCVHLWNQYEAGVEQRGYDRGKQVAEAGFALRDNKQLLAVIALKDTAEKRAAAAEAKTAAAEKLSVVTYQKGVKDGQAKTNRLVTSGVRLHDPGKQDPPGSACSDTTGPAKTASAGPGDHAKPGSELSGQASEFLFRLTGEADEVVKQLDLAQKRIIADMEQCNAPLPAL